MPTFHFQAVLDTLLHLPIQRMHEKELSHNHSLVVHTHAFLDQKIIVSKAPKNAAELAQYLQTTISDANLSISCMVAVNSDTKLTRFMSHDNSLVGQFSITRTNEDQMYDLLLFSPPKPYRYELTVNDGKNAAKKITAYQFSLDTNKSAIAHDDLILYVYNLFQELKAGNNIAIYSPSNKVHIFQIVLALCLLTDFDELFKSDNPEQIAHNILERMYKINRSSGLRISSDQIIDAVKIADITFTKYPKDFTLSPQHKVKPYSGRWYETNDDQVELLPKNQNAQTRKNGISICRLI